MSIQYSASLLSAVFILLLLTFSWAAASADNSHQKFLQCLSCYSNNSTSISKVIYTQKNSSYTTILQLTINNLRFITPDTPKPLVIVTPLDESQIRTVIFCSKKNGMQIRIRSGGHDFEGQSYVAKAPFVLLDMINLRSINVSIESATAWVEAGATIGELYYKIGTMSRTLGFPAGLWANVGVGGLISGGGYGMIRRKYGLAADNVIDARLIDVNGRILDRNSMGEDLFWAIRGGGGSSFGVILSWKLKFVHVPKVVTIFRIVRTLEQNATNIFHRWQYVAPKFPKHLDIKCYVQSIQSNSSTREDKRTIIIIFESLFLGRVDRLLPLIQERFPELGLVREDCYEVSWIESAPFFSNYSVGTSPDILLNRSALPRFSFKGKSDFAKEPISKEGLIGIWKRMFKVAPQAVLLQFTPFGGRMDEISESSLPFPHRVGTLYMINMGVFLDANATQRLKWLKSLYRYFRPYVSKSPRTAYVNYLDLDLGVNSENGRTSYAQASKWGKKYFKNNFHKLIRVKSVIDPDNFFRHEQSIPTLNDCLASENL